MARSALRVLLLSLAAAGVGWVVWWFAEPSVAAFAHLASGTSPRQRWSLADVVATSVALVAVGAYAVLVVTAFVAIGSHLFAPRRAAGLAARGWAGPTWWRTLVLAACGIGIAAQATAASADVHHGPPCVACAPSLDGLPYPDLPSGPWPREEHRQPGVHSARATHVVVREGDSLWSIAEGLSAPGARDADVAALTARLYTHNRDAIGDDADLIYPGTVLWAPGGSR